MNKPISIPLTKIEYVFTALAIVSFADPIALFQLLGDVFLGGENVRTFFMAAIAYITVLLIFIRRHRILSVIKQNRFIYLPILLLMVYVLLSVLWSIAPESSFKRVSFLFIGSIFAIYFTTRFDLKEQIRLVAGSLGFAAVLCVVFYFALPAYGRMGYGKDLIYNLAEQELRGAVRGIFIHKNALGRVMAIACLSLFCVVSDLKSYRQRLMVWAMFALCLGLLIAARSATAICVISACLCLVPIYKGLRWNSQVLSATYIILGIAAGTVITIVVGNLESVVGLFGRDVTLTGRTDLWEAVMSEIWQKPIFGYGYRAYWRGWVGPSASMWQQFDWLPPHSHNGFLDLWLELGIVGLIIFLTGFALIGLRSIYFARNSKSTAGLFPLLILSFFLFINLTESSIIRENIYWFLYLSVFSLSQSEV